MSAPEHVAPLEALVAVSREMAEHAGAGDWEAVTRLQQRRGRLMEQVFAGHGGEGAIADAAGALQTLVDLDRAILAATHAAHQEVAETLRQLGEGRRGVRAYGEAAGY